MPFCDVIVLVTPVFVDPPNAIPPVVVVKLRVVNGVEHPAEVTADYDTAIKGNKVNYLKGKVLTLHPFSPSTPFAIFPVLVPPAMAAVDYFHCSLSGSDLVDLAVALLTVSLALRPSQQRD